MISSAFLEEETISQSQSQFRIKWMKVDGNDEQKEALHPNNHDKQKAISKVKWVTVDGNDE